MHIIGSDFLHATLESDGYYFKLILNDSAAHFFPYTSEHRDATQPGLIYRDDSLGNALAGTIKPRQIDIRHHQTFTDQHVATVIQRLFDQPETQPLVGFSVRYQGRMLTI